MKLITGFCAVLAASAGMSLASLGGLDTAPLGDRNSAFVEYATWDTLTAGGTGIISNLPRGGGDLSLTLSQSVSFGFPYGNPGTTDLFYTSSRATSWTITGTASILTEYLVLQIRMSPPAASTGATTETFLAPQLNGIPATAALKTAVGLDADPDGLAVNGYDVMEWTWSGLDIPAGQTFTLTFSNPAGPAPGYHVAFDSFSVDVAPVPEPSTYGIMAGALLALIAWRRSRALKRVL